VPSRKRALFFHSLDKKISDAIAKLESLLAEEGQKGSESNMEQIKAAKDAITKAKAAIREALSETKM